MGMPKVLREIDVPVRGGTTKTIAVFSEHGPLLVTRDYDCEDEGFRITHAASGCAFGYFDGLAKARAAAKILMVLPEWTTIDASKPQSKELGQKVVPVIQQYGRMGA